MKRKTPLKKAGSRKKLQPQTFTFHRRIIYFIGIIGMILISTMLLLPNMREETNKCANTISCIENLSGNFEEASTGEFEGKQVTAPALAAKPYTPIQTQLGMSNVLGETTADAKRIYVDLTNQKLLAYENNTLVYEFPVSTGKYGTTPTGDFRIWIKLRYTRMKGGSKELGTYYDLPNVPYTMYFYNDKIPKARGYGIHGAYWHNNFGHPMSHGCVNMREADVAQLYNWALPTSSKNVTYASAENPGTLITIYGTAPTN